jgi:hypothetical protein
MTRRTLVAFLCGLAPALAFGWVAFPELLYDSVPQPLQFSHKIHVGETVGLTCEDCHGFRADGTFIGIPGVSKCTECHSEPLGETAQEKKLVVEYVTPQRETPWRVYSRQPDNAHFPHAQHVKVAAIACALCHGSHGTTEVLRPHRTDRISGYSKDVAGSSFFALARKPGDGMQMSDCEACHAQRKSQATACLDCHK